jgi:SAM-dependent methyltransferase
MTKVGIIGGGPGGLLTAYFLESKYKTRYRTTLFEATGRVGGKIVTKKFDTVPVIYEAGVAEFYDYSICGPDPLRRLIHNLGLQTVRMNGGAVVLNGQVLRRHHDIDRLSPLASRAIESFRKRIADVMPVQHWYEGNFHLDNKHEWAGRSCEELLLEVSDPTARRYLEIAVHSDLATEPRMTNGLNGMKNFLMDIPGYLRLYSIKGGLEKFPRALSRRLSQTLVKVDSPVLSVRQNPTGSYRVSYSNQGKTKRQDFDALFVALPHSALQTIDWQGTRLQGAMAKRFAYYDQPGHYLRISILFQSAFWRKQISGSWFTLDAFGGCCVYDESARHAVQDYGVLAWLIAGQNAVALADAEDHCLIEAAISSLPHPLATEAHNGIRQGKVHRWLSSVSGQPGGLPIQSTKKAHLLEPKDHPGIFMVGDYLFDSTLNGVFDSAHCAIDLLHSWTLKRRMLQAQKENTNGRHVIQQWSIGKSYFDHYHGERTYQDSFDEYFDAAYVRDLINLTWRVKPPYRLLDAGSACGLTLGDFSKCGIDAWGVERNKYIHKQTPNRFRSRNILGDVRRLKFDDNRFDFVYETCLAYLPESQVVLAIRELHRVARRGLIFGSITSDMNPMLFNRTSLLCGIKTLMTLWEWSELFIANGFEVAATDGRTVDALWRCEKRYNAGDDDWYPDRESLRYCFYTKSSGTN